MDREMQTLTRRIQTAQGPAEKSRVMLEMGNVRYARYKRTGEPDERRLASNCYLAAQNFFWKQYQTPSRRLCGTGIPY